MLPGGEIRGNTVCPFRLENNNNFAPLCIVFEVNGGVKPKLPRCIRKGQQILIMIRIRFLRTLPLFLPTRDGLARDQYPGQLTLSLAAKEQLRQIERPPKQFLK